MTATILLACLMFAGALPAPVQDPVDAEWRVRRGALESLDAAGFARDSSDWRERYQALDALNRRDVGRLGERDAALATGLLFDPQSNVRALALGVHARHGLPLPDSVGGLLEDPMPEVRMQLARALVCCEDEEAFGWLARLVLDGDPRVAREACAQLFVQGARARTVQAEFLQSNWTRLEPELFLQLLDVLDRSNESRALVANMEAWFDTLPAETSAVEGFAGRRALWATLADAQPSEAALALLVDHWLTPLPQSDPHVERKRRKRQENFQGAAAVGERLVSLLLERAESFAQRAGEEGEDAAELAWNSHELIVGALEVHFSPALPGPDEMSAEAWRVAREFPLHEDWSAAMATEVWSACFGRADEWGESLLLGLQHPSEDVRFAAWETLAEIWNRTRGLQPESWLPAVLQDPELAPAVYRSFLHSERRLRAADALHAWWQTQVPDAQLELLREHDTGRRYPLWRADLIALWKRGAGPQPALLELLGRFPGDEEIAGMLIGPLEAQIAMLEESSVPPKEVIRGPWRAAEARATWILEAWLGTREWDESGIAERRELLLRVGKLGKELGKRLVGELANADEGLDVLADVVLSEALAPRLRYEILLLHDDLPDEALEEELFSAYANCDDELRLRILRRAGDTQSALARALVHEVVFDAGAGPALRQTALDSMARQSGAVQELEHVLDDVVDYELKQSALGHLGKLASEHERLQLLQLYDDPLQRSLMGDELLATLVAIEVRAGSGLSEPVSDRWRGEAEDAAHSELLERFVSKRMAARNFVYSGWLRGAERLTGAGWLEDAMGDGWYRWDGRLLMRLAEVAVEGSEAADTQLDHRIQGAARVALLGEGPAGDRAGLLVRLRARLMLGALDARDWNAALALVDELLDGWRSGRISNLAVNSVFGPREAGRRDPRTALLAIEVECRVRIALALDDRLEAQRLLPRVQELSRSSSRMARKRLAVLLHEVPEALLSREQSAR